LEKKSEHPLSEAVIHYLGECEAVQLSRFESHPGRGVSGVIKGISFHVGSLNFMKKLGIPTDETLQNKYKEWSEKAMTILCFSDDNRHFAALALSDKIKTSSSKAVMELKQEGMDVSMLTGDSGSSAKAGTQQVDIEHHQAAILPGSKRDFVISLQKAV